MPWEDTEHDPPLFYKEKCSKCLKVRQIVPGNWTEQAMEVLGYKSFEEYKERHWEDFRCVINE